MKKVCSILLLIMSATVAQAQYKAAVGVRFDGIPNFTAKINTKGNAALEILLGGYKGGLKGTMLYELHHPAFGGNGWRWYYGAGGHVGNGLYRRYYNDRNYNGEFQLGADGIIGLEHTFTEIPLNLSVDWKPEFNITANPAVVLPVFGFSARLAF